MESHGIAEYLCSRLDLGAKVLPPMRKYMRQWIELTERIEHLKYEVTVALVGKYTRLEDSSTSITKALQHASNKIGYKVIIKFIEASNLEKAMLTEDPAAYHDAWHQLCKCE
jgi:CTP synthase